MERNLSREDECTWDRSLPGGSPCGACKTCCDVALAKVAELEAESESIIQSAENLSGSRPKSASDAMDGALGCARQLAQGESEQRIRAEVAEARLEELEARPPLNSGYFASDDDGMEFYRTAKEAERHASNAIEDYRDCCDPEWPGEVNNVCWGVVLGQATERRLDGEAPEGYEYMADYVLHPPTETSDQPGDEQP